MKFYLGQCVLAFAIMAPIVVNAVPLPSHNNSDLTAPKVPPSSSDNLWVNDAPGELDDVYDLPSVHTTSMTNIESTESATQTQDTAPYRVDRPDLSLTDAKALITKMLNERLRERSQYPWNKDGEWSDQVLRTVVGCIHVWQRNAVMHDLNRQAQVSNSSSSEPGHRILPSPAKRTAASNQLNRSQLNSHMDTLWTWAIRQKASLANLRCLSAQKKLSKFYQDPEHHPIPEKEQIGLLLASIPPSYNPSRPTIDMSKMPWHETKGTFQWKNPDDIKKVLFHIRTRHRIGIKKRNQLNELLNNGSREILVEEMDKAWKWWRDYIQKIQTRKHGYRYRTRVANREAKASSNSLPEKE